MLRVYVATVLRNATIYRLTPGYIKIMDVGCYITLIHVKSITLLVKFVLLFHFEWFLMWISYKTLQTTSNLGYVMLSYWVKLKIATVN